MAKERLYGLDALRLLSMLGIVGLHLLHGGGLLGAAAARPDSLLTARVQLLICSCSVNLFAMLTGWLCAEKRSFSTRRLLDLLLCTLFYCLLITAALALWQPTALAGQRKLEASLLPLFYGHYWYLSAYIMVFLLMPYLNRLLQRLSLRQLRTLTATLFVLLSVVGTVSYADPFRTGGGYGPIWLLFCYIVGVALQRGSASSSGRGRPLLWMCAAAGCIALSAALWYLLPETSVYLPKLTQYNSPLLVVCAACLLPLFSRLRLPRLLQKPAVSLSGAAFAVYIIHAHPILFSALLGGSLAATAGSRPHTVAAILALGCAAVYLCCWLCELLRQPLMRLLRLDRLTAWAAVKLDRLLGWQDANFCCAAAPADDVVQ